MDVVSVLPVAGDAVAISRLAKTVKKFAPLFTRAVRLGAITGVGEGAILLFDKIKNGEKLTMSDYRAALNIVTGLTTLKRVGGKNTPTKKKTEGFSDIKSVDGKNTVKLNSKAIDNIKNASPDTKLLKAQEEIVAAHRKKHPADKRSDEQIIDLYNIPTTSKAKH
jgi:hypothetical protein